MKCDICDLEFEDSDELVNHKREVHAKDPDEDLEAPANAPELKDVPEPAQRRAR